jgi:hypothetical protein
MGVRLGDHVEAESLVEAPRGVHLEDREYDRNPAPTSLGAHVADQPSSDAMPLSLGQEEQAREKDVIGMLLDREASDGELRLFDDPVGLEIEGLEETLVLPMLIPDTPRRLDVSAHGSPKCGERELGVRIGC